MRTLRYTWLGLLLALVVIGLAACGTPYTYNGTVLDPPKALTDFTLTDHDGQPFELIDQSGKLTLLYFGYTHCPDFCPATLADWKQVKQQLGADADKVRFAMITVDPKRDTDAVLKQYMAKFDPSFVGLRPTPEELSTLSRDYGVGVDMRAAMEGRDPDMHGTYVYAVDPKGQLREVFSSDLNAEQMTADIKHLLRSS